MLINNLVLLSLLFIYIYSIIHYLSMLTLVLYQNMLTFIYVGLVILESIAISVFL